jgi:hypothetical protein
MNLTPDKTVAVTVTLNDGRTEEMNITVPADKVIHKLIADTVEITFGTNNIVDFKIHE